MTPFVPSSSTPTVAAATESWSAPRVTAIGVARPHVEPGSSSGVAVEWQPRSRTDRRL